MNLAVIADSVGVLVNCECVKGHAYEIAATWVKCALLPVLAAIFGLTGDSCAHLRRTECLSPHCCPA